MAFLELFSCSACARATLLVDGSGDGHLLPPRAEPSPTVTRHPAPSRLGGTALLHRIFALLRLVLNQRNRGLDYPLRLGR